MTQEDNAKNNSHPSILYLGGWIGFLILAAICIAFKFYHS